MKKILLAVLVLTSLNSFSQKKSNGIVYEKHPAIDVVEAYNKAMNANDISKLESYLASDFKMLNATISTPYDKEIDKATFLKSLKSWREEIDYFSLSTTKGTYPDAIEYKDENQKDVVWVQTWDDVKGVSKTTGVKINMYIHRLFTVNKDNKIKSLFVYDNPRIYDEMNASTVERKNGTIYNHHENINSIRKMLYAFENKDYTKAYSFYDKDAKMFDINSKDMKPISLDQLKTNDAAILKDYDLVSIEQIGYPDYMFYEMGNYGIVYSWWTYHMIRKSDKKEINLPIHLQNTFNNDGKITSEIAYYNGSLFK